jgi:hypothetical protein
MANVNATLTCPHYGHEAHEIMPTDRCIVVYDCPSCARTLRPKAADCCVCCSYWASDILEGLESLWTKPLLYSARGCETSV